MKKLCKFIKSNVKVVVAFILGLALAGTGVYAATVIAGTSISYDNSNSGLSATDVQSAIDELSTKSTTKIEAARNECPSGYNCTQNYTCSGSSCKKCVRATSLHTEICSQTSTSSYCGADGYASGDTITYGSTGTSGTLSTGDAFDCDVDGDGMYNAMQERFYYVTDLDTNTAVLIYYNNVSEGVANTKSTSVYTNSANNIGPDLAVQHLPTINQWKNVNLKNVTRQIITETGGTTTSNGALSTVVFSYEGYAARLLTYQEVEAACYDSTTAINKAGGLSSKCKFLMENTKYSNNSIATMGAWLETPRASSSSYVNSIGANSRYVTYTTAANPVNNSVRPVIEVAKSDISY